jgi:signal transduction histidine kinase
LRFAYDDSALHVAIETAATLVGLMATFLLLGRVQRTHFLDELTLACGFSLLALSNLVFGALPPILGVGSNQVAAWGWLITSAAAAILICAASLLPRRSVSLEPGRAAVLVVAASTGFVIVTLLLVAMIRNGLPPAVSASAPEGSRKPQLVGHPAVLAVQLLLSLVFAVAAFGFFRRSRRTGDELSGWLAVGAVLASTARLNYFLYPSLYSKWVYSGDLFRLGFYVVLLIGAAREIASYWASTIAAAQLEERRRLARDLHDGLAQEIAFIKRNILPLHEVNGNSELVERIGAAADRAHLESRRIVAALTSRGDEPLEQALSDAARELAARYGAVLDLRLATGITLPPASQEALVRIAAEAVTNAAKHSGVRGVRVELARLGDGARLLVVDRGRGFDPTRRSVPSFGLTSMKERAEALGGRFQIRSKPGGGTEVEVCL